MNNINKDEGKRFKANKVDFAHKITGLLIKEHLENLYDFKENITKVINAIKEWNKIE